MILLDGGMGRHLQDIGAPFQQPEWSALSLIEDPTFITKAHNDFIDAGVDIITTNSYAIIPFHIGEDRFNNFGKELISLSGKLASDCKNLSDKQIRVAGSIPPVFGSYKPELFKAKFALPILRLFRDQLDAYCDLFIGETLSSIDEIISFQEVFAKCEKPVWLSMSLHDDDEDLKVAKLRSGELLSKAIGFLDFEIIESILFNCSQPEAMDSAIKIARKICPTKTAIGVYANGFPPINKLQKSANSQIREIRGDLDSLEYRKFTEKWLDSGATIIGGCCGIGPEHILELKKLRDEL